MAALSVSMNHATAKIIFFVFLAQITVMVNVCFANGDQSNILCHETEKQALLSFKRDLVDDYNKLVSWDVSKEEDCCKWARISCNTLTGHVSELSLKGGSFTGKINPSLLNLTHLLSLDLSLNNFSQIIPSFMGSLVSLRYLNFTCGGFKGKIPQQLGNLSSLHYLVLEDFIYSDYQPRWSPNDLYVDNLHWIAGLSSLESLVMNEVNLSKASDHWLFSINQLPSLQELRLSFCNLSHIHFPSHTNLTSLETLDLSYNSLELRGPIPCTIRNNMSLLKYLDLSDNNMDSIIPKCFYSFPNLAHLYLIGNNLQSISSDIANLTSLVSFDLSYNALAGNIPTSMGKLCNLEAIDLSNNFYKGSVSMVFEGLSGCLAKKLKTLRLTGNLFDSFAGHISDDELSDFKNLSDLSLAYNKFSGPIPKSLFLNLVSMKSLDVSFNNFNGPLPESLVSLSNLEFLDTSKNKLSGLLPNNLSSLSNLKYIDISKNQLSGPLPKSLGSLSNLEFLYIESNYLKGEVSEIHFANLTKLKIISASENQLNLKVSSYWVPPFHLDIINLRNWKLGPQFPIWLETQKDISSIDMSNTGITDTIPYWLWNLSHNGFTIDLSRNKIHGRIPNFHHPTWSTINLSSNKLEGPLPRISATRTLDLSYNFFSGEISHFLCNPKGDTRNLVVLDLKNNLFSGRIPDCWMYWQSLRLIDFDNNNFAGDIPSSIGSLRDLTSLHLRNNSITGEIPEHLKNCLYLLSLDLGLNKLVGSIPRWIRHLPYLSALVLRSNNMTGAIPIELCALSTLQVLDISNNNFYGIIPKCFNNLTSMTTKEISSNLRQFSKENANIVTKGKENQYRTILYLVSSLDLSSNKLSGEIPEELTSLQALQSLNLSRNYLSGSIPKKIGNMTELESLDLSWNNLSGNIPPGMSSLTFLSYLNMSYNNLSGEIPTSTQLQSLEASGFIGNQLCGPPLLKRCRDLETTQARDGDTKDEEKYWFRLGLGMGFGVSFAGVIGPLLVCGFWRRAYFWFFQNYLWNKILDFFIKVKYMY